MRYLSLFLPFLPTERIARQMSCPCNDVPSVIVADGRHGLRLVHIDATAARLGLKVDMRLSDARAQFPQLKVAEAAPEADTALLSRFLEDCRRYTPLVALDPPFGLMLDITGASHLFGGEVALAQQIEHRFAARGFQARTGIGPTVEIAWALARFGRKNRLGEEVAPEKWPYLMQNLPLAALNLPQETVQGLALAGLRLIGDICVRPRAPLTARFGPLLFQRLDGMFGGKTAISPQFEAPQFIAERRFADGLTHMEALELHLAKLVQELCVLLKRQAQGARQIELALFRVDGAVFHLKIGTGRPLDEAIVMLRLFREKLQSLSAQELDYGYGFDVLRLSARQIEALTAQTPSLIDLAAQTRADPHGLSDLADRLAVRIGAERIHGLSLCDRHWPEAAQKAVPLSQMPATAPPCPLERPIRLFTPPERIEVIAMVPDGPPMRFRWRRQIHDVMAVEGPERIAPEWWRQPPDMLSRDYFKAEDQSGQRFWLFRQGQFEQDTAQPHWFVHGWFG